MAYEARRVRRIGPQLLVVALHVAKRRLILIGRRERAHRDLIDLIAYGAHQQVALIVAVEGVRRRRLAEERARLLELHL